MNIYETENKIIIENPENFDLSDIFDCGQCFRFNRIDKNRDHFEGVAFGKYLRVYQDKTENKIYFETSLEDFNNIWRNFFDIDRDYKYIFETLRQDEVLRKASDFCPGVRILKQDPFECLISFIFSQNNNIPRIKKIIERLCENFGDKIIYNDNPVGAGLAPAPAAPGISAQDKGNREGCPYTFAYAFPSAERIANLALEELDVLKSGFRAKYIHGAAKKIASGEIDLNAVYKMPFQEGSEYLQQITGVGKKIAACVLLFAYNKLDAFPIDVWIKRVLEKYYPEDFDYIKTFGEYAGIAQEYLYYYERKK